MLTLLILAVILLSCAAIIAHIVDKAAKRPRPEPIIETEAQRRVRLINNELMAWEAKENDRLWRNAK